MYRFAALAALLLLSACGFQLRGSVALPFERLYIALPGVNELHATLKRNIEASSATRIVGKAAEAQVTLAILGDNQAKNILSLDTSGRVREYQLVRTFTFRLHDAAGRDWLPATQIVARRDISFNDPAILAKEAEEILLWRDMQNDLVQQILRRLSVARPPAAPPG